MINSIQNHSLSCLSNRNVMEQTELRPKAHLLSTMSNFLMFSFFINLNLSQKLGLCALDEVMYAVRVLCLRRSSFAMYLVRK
jgi:hypothetical protein